MIIGWREKIVLPDFSPQEIDAKIDTGARTSALGVSDIIIEGQGGSARAHFTMQTPVGAGMRVSAPHRGERKITSSDGIEQVRHVISATLRIGSSQFITEFTLSDRSDMQFSILIGRRALAGRFIVDSGKSNLLLKSSG